MSDKKIPLITASSVYSGQVEIKLTKKKKRPYTIKRHNNSTAEFHKFILGALIGSNKNIDRIYGIRLLKDIPLEINGYNPARVYNDIFPGVVLFSPPKPYVDSSSISRGLESPYYIKYHFLIPETFSDVEVGCIELCNVKGERYAYVDVKTEGNLLKIEKGTNVDVSWSLIVSSYSGLTDNTSDEQSYQEV